MTEMFFFVFFLIEAIINGLKQIISLCICKLRVLKQLYFTNLTQKNKYIYIHFFNRILKFNWILNLKIMVIVYNKVNLLTLVNYFN